MAPFIERLSHWLSDCVQQEFKTDMLCCPLDQTITQMETVSDVVMRWYDRYNNVWNMIKKRNYPALGFRAVPTFRRQYLHC
jgi:hypothetical protein